MEVRSVENYALVIDVDSDVTGCFGLRVREDAAEFTNMIDWSVWEPACCTVGLSTFISIRRHLRTAAKVVKLLKQLGGLS